MSDDCRGSWELYLFYNMGKRIMQTNAAVMSAHGLDIANAMRAYAAAYPQSDFRVSELMTSRFSY